MEFGVNKLIRFVFGARTKPTNCKRCLLTKEEAVSRHLAKGYCPDETHSDCAFKAEIRQAFLESKTPKVKWEIDKTQILENENVTLSWKVENAKKIEINNGVGEVDDEGHRTISIHRDTIYTLRITDYKDNVSEYSRNVNVTPLPVIEIRDKSLKIERGNIAILHWNASNINKIILTFDNQVIDVTNLNEFTVQPNEHTTYKLTFTALDNNTTIEKEIKIEVFPKPEIKLFEVSPEVVIASIPVTISWKVENAKKIEINNGVGEVTPEGNITILHDKNTLYKLTAWWELEPPVTSEIVVKVFPTPIIKSLLVPIPNFESRISLNPIVINPPKIDVAINMPEFNFELPDFNLTPPKFIEPSDDFLKLLRAKNKSKISIFNFSKIYEYFTK